MPRRLVYDGLNLGREHGTGVATYCRALIDVSSRLGNEIAVVHGNPVRPASRWRRAAIDVADHLACYGTVRPLPVGGRHPGAMDASGYASRNLFRAAEGLFLLTNRFARLALDRPVDLFHWTYPLPLAGTKAANIYTIHDLIPLRLPETSPQKKGFLNRLLKAIAARADHIVTVSEHSRRDIIELLGVEERRVSNTYGSADLPPEFANRPAGEVADALARSFRLDYGGYLLYFGALEPRKNVGRLIAAYRQSRVDLPLVLVAGGGWLNEGERDLIARLAAAPPESRRRLVALDYIERRELIFLIRGARAVLFPSLYEGFGLPVLEAMQLGTPVVTSNTSSLPEIAGDAALLADPYDTDALERAIRAVAEEDDLCAELRRRGPLQAAKFAPARYAERVKQVYDLLA